MARDWTGQFIHQRAAAAFNDRSSLASLRETAVQLAVMEKAATIACLMSSSNDSYRRNDAQTVPLSGQCLRIVFNGIWCNGQ